MSCVSSLSPLLVVHHVHSAISLNGGTLADVFIDSASAFER